MLLSLCIICTFVAAAFYISLICTSNNPNANEFRKNRQVMCVAHLSKLGRACFRTCLVDIRELF